MDILKAGGILIRKRRVLVERSKDKLLFIAPGGRIEADETAPQALVRELSEEFGIRTHESKLRFFGSFSAAAANDETLVVRMEVYFVDEWDGEVEPHNEVEEIAWVTAEESNAMNIGSIFQKHIIPRLKELDLID